MVGLGPSLLNRNRNLVLLRNVLSVRNLNSIILSTHLLLRNHHCVVLSLSRWNLNVVRVISSTLLLTHASSCNGTHPCLRLAFVNCSCFVTNRRTAATAASTTNCARTNHLTANDAAINDAAADHSTINNTTADDTATNHAAVDNSTSVTVANDSALVRHSTKSTDNRSSITISARCNRLAASALSTSIGKRCCDCKHKRCQYAEHSLRHTKLL